ncbi:hypothetical protein NMG60_11035791 [Bertholletia excelsa]
MKRMNVQMGRNLLQIYWGKLQIDHLINGVRSRRTNVEHPLKTMMRPLCISRLLGECIYGIETTRLISIISISALQSVMKNTSEILIKKNRSP